MAHPIPAGVAALSSCRHQGLMHLLDAHEAARELKQDPWSFACQFGAVLSQGIGETVLRWLVEQGLAEHRRETTGSADDVRRFECCPSLHFSAASCFALTPAGVALGRKLRDAWAHVKPHWDGERRMLWVADVMIKQFRVPAANQELILTAYEEEHWPAHLDDPLPPSPGIDPKARLHEAIRRLNLAHSCPLLLFHGDGTGRGLHWSLTPRPLLFPRAHTERPLPARSAGHTLRPGTKPCTMAYGVPGKDGD